MKEEAASHTHNNLEQGHFETARHTHYLAHSNLKPETFNNGRN